MYNVKTGSQAIPSQQDIEQSSELSKNVLSKEYEYPEAVEAQSNEETEKRTRVVRTLQEYINTWISSVAKALSISDSAKARLFTFGSFFMDVAHKDGDVDTLLVAPDYTERDKHFFGSFLELLQGSDCVKELQAIKDAYVPVIKMKMFDVMVDIVFARVSRKELESPTFSLSSESLLQSMDAEMIRSVNGYRTGKKILETVPNADNFRMTLRAIKLWARKKAIYCNPQGFLSGISCAILTASVCVENPDLQPNQLIYAFFETYAQWLWQENPVRLKDNATNTKYPPLVEKSWSDTDKALMMVITPVYPFINTTYNISGCSFYVITMQLQSTYEFLRQAQENRRPISWEVLFEPYEFFRSYIHFLEVRIFSKEGEQFLTWKGYIESKLKNLTRYLEFCNTADIMIHPYPAPITLKEEEDTYKHCVAFYYGIKWSNFNKPHSKEVDLSKPVYDFIQEIYVKKMDLPECEISFMHLTREELVDSVFDEPQRPSWAIKKYR